MLSSVLNHGPNVFKDLSVAQHPVSIEEHQHRSKLKKAKSVDCQLVVEGWWLLHEECHNDSFTDILVDEVESSDWEENRHADSVHHGDEDDVQDTRVLEVNDIVLSTVKVLVRSHGCLLGGVQVMDLEFPVKSSDHEWDHEGSRQANIWQDCVDHHCLHNFVSNVRIPVWHVVIEWTLDIFGEDSWLMLSHVSIDQQDQDTSVEELGNEHSIGNGSKLLTVGVLSHPGDSFDDHSLQNQVDGDDDE